MSGGFGIYFWAGRYTFVRLPVCLWFPHLQNGPITFITITPPPKKNIDLLALRSSCTIPGYGNAVVERQPISGMVSVCVCARVFKAIGTLWNDGVTRKVFFFSFFKLHTLQQVRAKPHFNEGNWNEVVALISPLPVPFPPSAESLLNTPPVDISASFDYFCVQSRTSQC